MSFSSDVKIELSKITSLANKENVKMELLGYLCSSHCVVLKNSIKFSTENEYNINRFSKLLSNLGIVNQKIDIQGKIYTIVFPKQSYWEEIEYCKENVVLKPILMQEEGMKKAFIRGVFLGGGSVNDPQKSYHLEILCNEMANTIQIQKELEEHEIAVKILQKNAKEVILYQKEGEEISKLLAFMGANQAVLRFEEIRVLRDMKNNVNRIVNCETANLNKTISASIKQIRDIQYLKKNNHFKDLNSSLQEVAILREENPDISLIELGKLLPNPIGKSGVNHRLKAISQIAEEIRRKEKKE